MHYTMIIINSAFRSPWTNDSMCVNEKKGVNELFHQCHKRTESLTRENGGLRPDTLIFGERSEPACTITCKSRDLREKRALTPKNFRLRRAILTL